METDLAGLSLVQSCDIHRLTPYWGFLSQQAQVIPAFWENQSFAIKISPQNAESPQSLFPGAWSVGGPVRRIGFLRAYAAADQTRLSAAKL